MFVPEELLPEPAAIAQAPIQEDVNAIANALAADQNRDQNMVDEQQQEEEKKKEEKLQGYSPLLQHSPSFQQNQ